LKNKEKRVEKILNFEKDGYIIYENESYYYCDEDLYGVDSIEDAYIYDDIEEAKNNIEDSDNAYSLEIHKVKRIFTVESILTREVIYNEKSIKNEE